MNDTTPQLTATHEIMAALLNSDLQILDGVEDLKADPEYFIVANFGYNPFAGALSIVDNNADTINICLPYYDGIEGAKARMLEDADAQDVAGGEVVTIVALTAVAAGVGIGITAGVRTAQSEAALKKARAEFEAAQAELNEVMAHQSWLSRAMGGMHSMDLLAQDW